MAVVPRSDMLESSVVFDEEASPCKLSKPGCSYSERTILILPWRTSSAPSFGKKT